MRKRTKNETKRRRFASPSRVAVALLSGAAVFGAPSISNGNAAALFASATAAEESEFAEKSAVSSVPAANLFRPISLTCDGEELRSILERFSEICEIAYFIDRRVDPSTLLAGSFSDEPAIDALRKMLDDAELSFCCVDGSLIWVGPRDASGELLLLFALKREEFDAAPEKVAEKLTSTLDFSFPDFAEPRDVFQTLSKRTRLKFDGFEKTPFDRWRAAEFRDVVAADLISTLSIGFNVDFRWDADANALKPVALDRSRAVERSYSSALVRKLDRKNFPNVEFSENADGETVGVAGAFADVARVEYAVALLGNEEFRRSQGAALASNGNGNGKNDGTGKSGKNGTVAGRNSGNSARKNGGARKEVSGSLEDKRLRDVFTYFETNFGLTFELDDSLTAAGVTLETRISCEFRNADARKVAATIAGKIGSTFKIDGNRVVFSKSKKR